MVELINSFPDFNGSFGDKRIEKKAAQALQKLTMGRNSSLRQITENNAEQKNFYRLFNNESFSEERIEQSIVKRCAELCKDRHVLCIQDTTEFNLSRQRGRVKVKSGLGKTSKNDVLGFMLHSSLVVDANRGNALGYSYIKTWERKETMPDRYVRNYQQLPIEQKESYKWIAAAKQSEALLQQAELMTIIADRESDIYDLIAAVDGQKVHLLIRSNFNRRIADGNKLAEHLNELPVMYEYEVTLNGDIRKGIEKRRAHIALKWSKTGILKSEKTKNKKLASSKEVYVVEARETNRTKGIYWRILTTHPVTNAEQALQIIDWFKQRWHIEQIHRLLKTEGFRIERSQLEQGWAIQN